MLRFEYAYSHTLDIKGGMLTVTRSEAAVLACFERHGFRTSVCDNCIYPSRYVLLIKNTLIRV